MRGLIGDVEEWSKTLFGVVEEFLFGILKVSLDFVSS
jgi:hypothetical protein